MEEKLIFHYSRMKIKKALNIGILFIMLCQTKAKKEVIFFIAIAEFQILRDKILENSKKILELIDERREISEKIGKLKKLLNLSTRDIEREIEVERSIKFRDKFIVSSLRYLFEFSIYFQEETEMVIPWKREKIDGENYLSLEGEKFLVEVFSGIYFGSFGKRVFLNQKIPQNMIFGFIVMGSHIIIDKGEKDLPRLNFLKFNASEASLIVQNERLKLLIPEKIENIYKSEDLVIV